MSHLSERDHHTHQQMSPKSDTDYASCDIEAESAMSAVSRIVTVGSRQSPVLSGTHNAPLNPVFPRRQIPRLDLQEALPSYPLFIIPGEENKGEDRRGRRQWQIRRIQEYVDEKIRSGMATVQAHRQSSSHIQTSEAPTSPPSLHRQDADKTKPVNGTGTDRIPRIEHPLLTEASGYRGTGTDSGVRPWGGAPGGTRRPSRSDAWMGERQRCSSKSNGGRVWSEGVDYGGDWFNVGCLTYRDIKQVSSKHPAPSVEVRCLCYVVCLPPVVAIVMGEAMVFFTHQDEILLVLDGTLEELEKCYKRPQPLDEVDTGVSTPIENTTPTFPPPLKAVEILVQTAIELLRQ
eukprot:GHVN01055063.1.p1 GENE.GHVN01055063.1~~GHVN01055063.1.p1  ORF type:complete len:346 (+),score=73.13 GHVN01055063.1:213-1250(+)